MFYRKKVIILSKIVAIYVLIVTVINTVLPFIYFNIYEYSKDASLTLYYFVNDHLLNWQLGILYFVVHKVVFNYIKYKKITTTSVYFYSLITIPFIEAFGIEKVAIVMNFFVIVNMMYIFFLSRIKFEKINYNFMLLFVFYVLYSLSIIIEFIFTEKLGFLDLSKIYPLIAILALVPVFTSYKNAARYFLNKYYKISFSIILIIISLYNYLQIDFYQMIVAGFFLLWLTFYMRKSRILGVEIADV
jgi:hypothetical protein